MLIRDVEWQRALVVTAKVGVLTVVTSLWWLAGLSVQGNYGLNVLKYTETLQTVSSTSLASEVLRGLGYWFFYGIDKIGHWTDASVTYTRNPASILISFAVPTLALLAAACVRWRHRAFFVGAGGDRRRGVGRRVPLRRSLGARWAVQVVRRVVELRARARSTSRGCRSWCSGSRSSSGRG